MGLNLKTNCIALLASLIFVSCANSRISLIEEIFRIDLPTKYEVLKNTSESAGLAGADFEINIHLKFQEKGFDELNNELLKIDSFKLENKYSKDLINEFATLELDSINQVLKFRLIHI